jgi:transposase
MDRRRIIDATLYVVKCGSPWRYLPTDFRHWKTVYHNGFTTINGLFSPPVESRWKPYQRNCQRQRRLAEPLDQKSGLRQRLNFAQKERNLEQRDGKAGNQLGDGNSLFDCFPRYNGVNNVSTRTSAR